MLTPQQIQEISFEKALFGGYDMDSVDEVLEPLTQDYVTLYKENSVLKSKMRILVEKLEEYRRQEASMQNAILAAQKTSEQMLLDTEKKCARLLHEAEETANAKSQNIDALLGSEKERLESAQNATAQFIDSMEKRLHRQLELLEELRKQELPEKAPETVKVYGKPMTDSDRAFDFDRAPSSTTQEKADALIEEIGAKIEESLNGPLETPESAPLEATRKLDALHGTFSPNVQKAFDQLQFGHNNKK